MSRFLVAQGLDPHTPLTLQLPPNHSPENLSIRVERLQQHHYYDRKMVEAAHAVQKESAKRKRLPGPFEFGDYVRVSTQDLQLMDHPTKKLRPRFLGPYLVSKAFCLFRSGFSF